MNPICLFVAALMACAYAQIPIPRDYTEGEQELLPQVRHPRDLSWERNMGRGQVFGQLGQNDYGLYGRGGYRQDIFDDHRGRLQGSAYGSRTLGSYGDSTSYGGRLDWNNDNAKAGLDLNKQVHGGSSLSASGAGLWKVGKDTTLSAGGAVVKDLGHGRPDVAIQAGVEHKF